MDINRDVFKRGLLSIVLINVLFVGLFAGYLAADERASSAPNNPDTHQPDENKASVFHSMQAGGYYGIQFDRRTVLPYLTLTKGEQPELSSITALYFQNQLGGFFCYRLGSWFALQLDLELLFYQIRKLQLSDYHSIASPLNMFGLIVDVFPVFHTQRRIFLFQAGMGPGFMGSWGAYSQINVSLKILLDSAVYLGNRFALHLSAKLGMFLNAGFGNAYEALQSEAFEQLYVNFNTVEFSYQSVFIQLGLRFSRDF